MQKIYLGYIQGTHGLRGDLKVKTTFSKPEYAFLKSNKILLNEEEHTITSSKIYKNSYLIGIDNLKNINLVEKYKGYDIYILRENLNLDKDEYLREDLYDLEIVCNNKRYGKVKNIEFNGKYDILLIKGNKEFMIPNVNTYIKKIDLVSGIIECTNIEGLIL